MTSLRRLGIAGGIGVLMAVLAGLSGLTAVAGVDHANVPLQPARKANPAPKSAAANNKPMAFTPDREAAALSFVGRNHPELAPILAKLKSRNVSAYQDAIIDLFRTSETLADQRQRDPNRHELALEVWKAKSRVDVLAAQVADPASKPSLANELRQALSHQIEVEIRKHQNDLKLLQARERKLQDQIQRLERDQTQVVEARLKRLVDRGRKARRPSAGKTKDAKNTKPTSAKPNNIK